MRPDEESAGNLHSHKAQSAMEFLMTYGWSILIIAVVIVALYALGAFSGSASGGTSTCLATTGFICTGPIMYSSGSLNVTIGQIGSTITVTAMGCSSSNSAPSNEVNIQPITIASGQRLPATFQCSLQSNKVGTSFSGSLWLQYNSQGFSGQLEKIAVIDARVTAVNQSFLLANVIINIDNTNTLSATGSSFQQMIFFNPSQTAYSTNEVSDLGNIRFYLGSGAPSVLTELYSWCESGCTSSSANAVYWIVLPAGVPANSNVVVNMGWLSKTTEYDGIYAGEAPQQSGSWAEYDNGASVFSLYTNKNLFATTPGGWTNTISTTNAVLFLTYNNSVIAPPFVEDSYGSYLTSAYSTFPTYSNTPVNNGGEVFVGLGNNQGSSEIYLRDNINGAAAIVGPYTTATQVYTLGVPSNTVEYGEINYGSLTSLAYTVNSPKASTYIGIFGAAGSANDIWFRVRAYPPGGVMPTFSFGAVS